MANGLFGGGDGSAASPFLIEDAEDLSAIRHHDNTAQYKLKNSVNLGVFPYNTGKGWAPIDNDFGGVLDGDGYKILNLYCNRPAETNVGLFRRIVTKDACDTAIQNIRFENTDLTGAVNVGTVAGQLLLNRGGSVSGARIIQSCHFAGRLEGSIVGGAFGRVDYGASCIAGGNFLISLYATFAVTVQPTAVNPYYGCVYGYHSNTSARYLNNAYILSQSEFIPKINGVANAGLTPPTFGGCVGGIFGNANCFYNADKWPYAATTGTTGLKSAAFATNLFSDFDQKIYADGSLVWDCTPGRAPVLRKLSRRHFLIADGQKYYAYNGKSGKFDLVGEKEPTKRQAMEWSFDSIEEAQFSAWDELRKNGVAVELVEYVEDSGGTVRKLTAVSLMKNTLQSQQNAKKNYFSAAIDLNDYKDVIANITKGAME